MKKILLSLLLTIAATVIPSNAELVVYEGFDYGASTISDINGLNGGGGGFSAAWRDGNSGGEGLIEYSPTGLSYSDGSNSLSVVGGASVAADTGNPELYFREFTTPSGLLDTGNKVFFSFLSSASGDGSRGFGLVTSDTNFGLRVYRVSSGFWQLQVGGTSQQSSISTDGFNGMILGRITMQENEDLIEIWGNPTLTSEGDLGTADATISANTPGFNRFRIEHGNFPTASTFDEIRVATTFNEAIGIVPEPSSYALISGALALGLIMVRRRR